jgi:hypothetical protein
VGDVMLVQPGARLLHGVAVFDAVDGDAHVPNSCSVRPYCPDARLSAATGLISSS